MSTISAADVGKLRAATGAGLMDCKKALSENAGDLEKAKDWLRKRGLQIAAKKSDREIKAGAVFAHVDEAQGLGVMLELGCETDFVARNEEFQAVGKALLQQVAAAPVEGPAQLLDAPYSADGSAGSVKEKLQALSAKIGENIQLGRVARFAAGASGAVHSYTHFTGTLGVLLELEASSADVAKHEETKALAKEVCLHIAFAKPVVLRREDLPADAVAREREVYMQSDKLKGKPENMIGKIVDGMMETFFKEKSLLDQPFVKDDKKSVRQFVTESAKKAGGSVELKRFALFSVGAK